MNNFFNSAKYNGIFNDGWDRWWADLIIAKFKELTNKKLSFLTAEERVSLLKTHTGIQVKIAKPLKFCNSSEFWTICEGYKMPLDPLEGFKIQPSKELKSWQESKYLSLKAILERLGIDKGLKPHFSELERIEEIKKHKKIL